MPTFGYGPLPNMPAADFGRMAHHLEELGFDNLWVPDERFFRHIVVTLTAAAASTEHLKIGSAVTDPFVRHPALTAQWAASLDEFSEGRLVLGIGAGVAGFEAMGIKRDRPVLAIREMIELMRLLWTGETVDYQGKTVQFRNSRLDSLPLRPRIPCYVAGRGPKVLQLGGEIGEGVMIGSLASEPGLNYAFRHIDAGLKAANRGRSDIDVAIWLHTAIHEDAQAAREAVKKVVVAVLLTSPSIFSDLGIPVPVKVMEGLKGVRYGHSSPGMDQARALITDDIIGHFAVAGNPEEVASRVRALSDAGINHFGIKPWLVPGQTLDGFAETLSKGVISKFK